MPKVEPERLLPLIESFLEASGLSASRFGRYAGGDPGLIYDLRNGREVRAGTATKIVAEIERRRPGFIEHFLTSASVQ